MRVVHPFARRPAARALAALALGVAVAACRDAGRPARVAADGALDRDLGLARVAVEAPPSRAARTRFVSALEAGTAAPGAARRGGHRHDRRASRVASVRVAAPAVRARRGSAAPAVAAVTLPAPAPATVEAVAAVPEPVMTAHPTGDAAGDEHAHGDAGRGRGEVAGDGGFGDGGGGHGGVVIRGGRVGDDDMCERDRRGGIPIGTPPWGGGGPPVPTSIGRIIPVLAGGIGRRAREIDRERVGGGIGGAIGRRGGGGPFRF